jgi:hypothetical protein
MKPTLEQALLHLAPVGRGAGALVRLALALEDGHYHLLTGSYQTSLQRPSRTSLRHYDYTAAQFVLTERWLTRSQAAQLLDHLTQDEAYDFPGLGIVRFPKLSPTAYYSRSGQREPFVPTDWPTIHVQWAPSNWEEHALMNAPDERVVAARLPLFPNARTAILSFVHGYHEGNNQSNTLRFLAYTWDQRARIRSLELRGMNLVVHVDQDTRTRCHIRPYGTAVVDDQHRNGVMVCNGEAVIVLRSQTDNLLLGLVNQHGELLDERQVPFGPYGRVQSGVVVTPQTREIQVEQWIEGGENWYIEFKQDAKGGKDHQELLESVVAFANGAGGIILVGVTNNGDVQGFKRGDFSDMLMGLLHTRCDPVPSVQVEEVMVHERPLTLVHVYSHAPGVVYSLDKNKFFMRAGATDRLARREELALLLYPPDHDLLSRRF